MKYVRAAITIFTLACVLALAVVGKWTESLVMMAACYLICETIFDLEPTED